MLERHLREWITYENQSSWNVVIVDDCSKENPIENYLNELLLLEFNSVKVFKILDDIPWNQNGARNLAMLNVKDAWCVSTDIDHLITKNVAKEIVNMTLPEKTDRYFRPHRILFKGNVEYKKHPNSYIIHSDLYWKVGGMDESFCGWYGSDSVFRRRLEAEGREQDISKNIYLTLYGRDDIPDASTTQYGRKDSPYHSSNNEELKKRRKFAISPIKPINFRWEQLC
jgi:hypothetical protein